MQLKPTTAIAVLLLVVASLSVAGCTVILPESQNTQHHVTTKVASSGNLTVSVQALESGSGSVWVNSSRTVRSKATSWRFTTLIYQS